MNRFLLLFVFLYLPGFVWAQQEQGLNYQEIDHKILHFGFTIGVNTMDFKVTPTMDQIGVGETVIPELNVLSPGIHVGAVSSLKLTEDFHLRFLPGITLGQRAVLFYRGKTTGNKVLDKEMTIESTFVDLPLLLKYSSVRVENFRPYLLGGANFRYDMARNKDFNEDEGIYIKLNPMDLCYELGFGVDWYLPYFKLSTEIKYSVGIMNVASSDQAIEEPEYANAVESLNSRLFMVSFHFE
jgi:hypothetical protein